MTEMSIKLRRLEALYRRMEEQVHFDHNVLEEMQRSIIFDYADSPKPKPTYTALSIQSEDVVEQVITEEQVLTFADNVEGVTDGMVGVRDSIVEDIDTSKFELGDFLNRPVRIATYAIPLGEAYNQRLLRPWQLFFNDPSIRKKLDNYAYIQADLKVKLVVNSTPFIYGMYAMSYRPLTTFGAQHEVTTGGSDNVDRTVLTQRPTVYIESHKNKGGELTLPFFYHKNWLSLTNAETTAMGQLSMYPIVPFTSANGTATGPVSVLVYAWAENVKLAGNTVNLAIQAKDEYGTGPVSRVASAVGGFSRHLEKVPIIGKFAKATTIGAKAVGAIASLFGFTNVPVIDNVQPLKNQPFHGFASSQIGVPMEKLTLDPKNELSIDPGIAGLPADDELAIANIAKRPALIRVVRWRSSDVTDTSLFRANVTPTWCRTVGSAPTQYYVDLPMAHIARLFSNWRGDLMIRLVFIKSQYHQGRLRVNYDPVGDIYSNANSETTTITKVIDIETTDYLEFRIPYMQPQSWLRVIPTIQRDTAELVETNTAYNVDYHNGRFEIRVLNTLTAPVNTADAHLAIFAYAADNFELSNPSDFQTTTSVFAVQSSDEMYEQYEMGKCTPRPAEIMSVNFGEDVRSMRTLMRRTCLHMSEGIRNTFSPTANSLYTDITSIRKNIYPLYYGYDSNSDYLLNKVTTGSVAGNKCKETPYTWMSPLFVGQRGSMHYSFNHVDGKTSKNLLVQRHNEPFSVTGIAQTFSSYSTLTAPNALNTFYGGITGQALENELTQTGLQFSVPFMNKFRFCSTSPGDRANGADYDDSENNNFVVSSCNIDIPAVSSTLNVGAAFLEYHSIGVDYTPLWFLSTTKRWIYDVNAA